MRFWRSKVKVTPWFKYVDCGSEGIHVHTVGASKTVFWFGFIPWSAGVDM